MPHTDTGPLIFVATNRLEDGKLEAERARAADLVAFIDDNESQLIAFNEYVNEAGTEVTVVQVHPDAASFRKHLGVVRDRAAAAYAQTLDGTVAIQIYGPIDDDLLHDLRSQTGDGVALTIARDHVGGFTRSQRPGNDSQSP